MPRKPLLQGVPRQLQEAAKRNLNPFAIARDVGEFADVLSLSRFVHQQGWDALDDLSKATELATAIVNELEKMKPSHLGKTKSEQQEREWRIKLIDGTYALTEEWQEIPRIMPRREILIGKRPGRSVSMRTHIDTDEREIHEELAERLSRSPVAKASGLSVLYEANDLMDELRSASDADSESQLWVLFVYAAAWERLDLARQLVARLIAERERNGSDAPGDIGWILFKCPGPLFTMREHSALLAAYREPRSTLHPFLEQLESSQTGIRVIGTWKEWLTTADWDALYRPFTFARVSLDEGFGTEVLREIGETGSLDPMRSYDELLHLIQIGAILGLETDEAKWHIQPLWKFRYWPRRDRESRQGVPFGWCGVWGAIDRDWKVV
ncbi:MAG: hypothetical protein ACJ75S_02875 [Solirubrobacterales bacterium]